MQHLFENISYFGMLCLGAFIGGIMNYGLTYVKDDKSFLKVLPSILSGAFSGSLFIFIKYVSKDKADNSIYMYPVGLILSLLWLQIPDTINDRIAVKGDGGKNFLGWAHLVLVGLVTIIIVCILLFGGKIS